MTAARQERSDMEALVEQLADAVSLAASYFNARDEMNAAVHAPAEVRLSPITVMMNEAMQAWRDWRFAPPPDSGGSTEPDEVPT